MYIYIYTYIYYIYYIWYIYIHTANTYLKENYFLPTPKKCVGFIRSSCRLMVGPLDRTSNIEVRETPTSWYFERTFETKIIKSYSYVCHLYHVIPHHLSFHPFLPPFRKKKMPTQKRRLELFGSLLSRHPNTHLQQQHRKMSEISKSVWWVIQMYTLLYMGVS